MTDYECSWWENAGKQTPWVDSDDGISRSRMNIFRNLATGEELTSRDLPIGALYAISEDEHPAVKREPFASGFPPCGHDGYSISCVCIGHHWYIDYRASNCTMKEDKVHRCWVRHGTIGERLTVDKAGNTCQAGGGSFFMDGQKWHGFLQDGWLRGG